MAGETIRGPRVKFFVVFSAAVCTMPSLVCTSTANDHVVEVSLSDLVQRLTALEHQRARACVIAPEPWPCRKRADKDDIIGLKRKENGEEYSIEPEFATAAIRAKYMRFEENKRVDCYRVPKPARSSWVAAMGPASLEHVDRAICESWLQDDKYHRVRYESRADGDTHVGHTIWLALQSDIVKGGDPVCACSDLVEQPRPCHIRGFEVKKDFPQRGVDTTRVGVQLYTTGYRSAYPQFSLICVPRPLKAE